MKGLDIEFMRKTCGFPQSGKKQCAYLRMFKGMWVCAKGTATGEKHKKRMEGLAKDVQDGVVFDSGAGESKQFHDPEGVLITGDNCPGRAHEFVHLFGDEQN